MGHGDRRDNLAGHTLHVEELDMALVVPLTQVALVVALVVARMVAWAARGDQSSCGRRATAKKCLASANAEEEHLWADAWLAASAREQTAPSSDMDPLLECLLELAQPVLQRFVNAAEIL